MFIISVINCAKDFKSNPVVKMFLVKYLPSIFRVGLGITVLIMFVLLLSSFTLLMHLFPQILQPAYPIQVLLHPADLIYIIFNCKNRHFLMLNISSILK